MADRAKALDLLCQRVLSNREQIGDAWAHHAHRHELLWGDYHLMETLYCLEKKGLPC